MMHGLVGRDSQVRRVVPLVVELNQGSERVLLGLDASQDRTAF